MINTTLCYITRADQVLMLHRTKKKNDINQDKWIGIGGKFEGEEAPEECLLREEGWSIQPVPLLPKKTKEPSADF